MKEYNSKFLWSHAPAGLHCMGGKEKLALLLWEIVPCSSCIFTCVFRGLSRCCKDLGASAGVRIKSSGILQPHRDPESTQKELFLTKHQSSEPWNRKVEVWYVSLFYPTWCREFLTNISYMIAPTLSKKWKSVSDVQEYVPTLLSMCTCVS